MVLGGFRSFHVLVTTIVYCSDLLVESSEILIILDPNQCMKNKQLKLRIIKMEINKIINNIYNNMGC